MEMRPRRPRLWAAAAVLLAAACADSCQCGADPLDDSPEALAGVWKTAGYATIQPCEPAARLPPPQAEPPAIAADDPPPWGRFRLDPAGAAGAVTMELRPCGADEACAAEQAGAPTLWLERRAGGDEASADKVFGWQETYAEASAVDWRTCQVRAVEAQLVPMTEGIRLQERVYEATLVLEGDAACDAAEARRRLGALECRQRRVLRAVRAE